MSPTVLPTRQRPSGVTGQHVLLAMVLFFGTIFAVNGVLIYKALSTHSGLVANEPYRKGLNYNARIAADERQRALGWTETVGLDMRGRVQIDLADAKGQPLTGLALTGFVGRPSEERHDRRLKLTEREPGRYVAEAGALDAGTWLVALDVRPAFAQTPGSEVVEPIYRIKRRLWLKP